MRETNDGRKTREPARARRAKQRVGTCTREKARRARCGRTRETIDGEAKRNSARVGRVGERRSRKARVGRKTSSDAPE